MIERGGGVATSDRYTKAISAFLCFILKVLSASCAENIMQFLDVVFVKRKEIKISNKILVMLCAGNLIKSDRIILSISERLSFIVYPRFNIQRTALFTYKLHSFSTLHCASLCIQVFTQFFT